MEPLGQHMLQKAPDELMGGHRHGFPTLVLGGLGAKAHLAVIDREETGIGERDAVDLSAQVVQDCLWAVYRRFAVDHPPLVQSAFGMMRSGRSWRSRSSNRPRHSFARAWTGTR